MMRRIVTGGVALLLLALAVTVIGVRQAQAQHPNVNTSNPYTGAYGPPDCTWYGWQRLHDVEGIDLQFHDNAGNWIIRAQQANEAWSESANAFVQVQVNTTPSAGDLVVFPYPDGVWAWTTDGHVAFVESVSGNGQTIAVSQQSYQDYSPGANTSPYPWVRHYTIYVPSMQRSQQGHARFLHFVVPATPPPATATPQPAATDTPVPAPPPAATDTPMPGATDTPVPPPPPAPTDTPVPPAPTDTPVPPPPPPTWQPVLQQFAPGCNDPGGVAWDFQQNDSGNVFQCTGSGLLMQMGQTYYPEANLSSINGGYDPNMMQAKVHVHFVNVNNSTYAGTDAAIVVQTPPAVNQCGGLLFEVRPNGQWRVQQVNSDCTMPVIYNGQVGASSDYDLAVIVQNGQLTGLINGSAVGTWGDNLSGGVTGLMVVDFAWPTAQVYYTNYELDQWR